ncbi:MAG: hypothetical protein ACKOOL_01925 [Novosphingobium sp.]
MSLATLVFLAAAGTPPPATQTCADGSVILATEECTRAPGYETRPTQVCPDGSVILAKSTCPPAPFQPQLVCKQAAATNSADYPAEVQLGMSPGRRFVLMLGKTEYAFKEKPADAPRGTPDEFRAPSGIGYRFTVGTITDAMRQTGRFPVLIQRSAGKTPVWLPGKNYVCNAFDPRPPRGSDDEDDGW